MSAPTNPTPTINDIIDNIKNAVIRCETAIEDIETDISGGIDSIAAAVELLNELYVSKYTTKFEELKDSYSELISWGEDLENKVSTMESNINELESNNNYLENRISQLENVNDDLQSDINDLKSELNDRSPY